MEDFTNLERMEKLCRDCRHDERQRCIEIIQGFADLLGPDSFGGKPRHALLLAIEMIEDDDQ